jgi:4-amino-4-deoxy-L-arabinose transferase-like glycosyltransferase
MMMVDFPLNVVGESSVAKRPYSQYNQPPMSEQTCRRWLALILNSAYTLLGVTYALTTPPFEASDELWHYPMIRHLADGNPLPVQVFDPAQAGPWKQEASQPPLYYYLGAALTFWIDTSDMERCAGKIPTSITAFSRRWQHQPHQKSSLEPVAGHAAGGADCAPFFGFAGISHRLPDGAVNNDNLVIPLVALALLLLIWAVKEGPGAIGLSELPWGNTAVSETSYWLILGVVIGLAALTKISGVGLLPLAWGTLVVTRWQAWQADKAMTA